MEYFKNEKVTEHITRIYGVIGEAMYLVEGMDRALLIDTGCGIGNIRAYVEGMTALPLTVWVTHGHYDHAGGMYTFDSVFINKEELAPTAVSYTSTKAAEVIKRENFPESMNKDSVRIRDIEYNNLADGDEIDLGEITCEAIMCPGHTPCTMCVLIKEERVLLTGDACHQITYLHFDSCLSVKKYRQSLGELVKRESEWDRLILSHAGFEDTPRLIHEIMNRCDEVLEGRAETLTSFDDTGFHMIASKDGEGGRLLFDTRRIKE